MLQRASTREAPVFGNQAYKRVSAVAGSQRRFTNVVRLCRAASTKIPCEKRAETAQQLHIGSIDKYQQVGAERLRRAGFLSTETESVNRNWLWHRRKE
jgi:hypothetical protein